MTAQMLAFRMDPEVVMELTRKIYEGNFFAIWTREVVQNSSDALASKIEIWNSCPDSLTTLRVKDNGLGMPPKVIHEAFLALGGSQKESSAAVGGFGIAKTVVLAGTAKGKSPIEGREGVYWYVMTTYEEDGALKTLYFDSEMMEKEPLMELEAKEASGTEIVVYRKEYCSSSRIINVLENCNIAADLFYNGDEIMQLDRARKKHELGWCDVYYKKKCFPHQRGSLIVRMGGVYQFEQYISHRVPGVAIAEIAPGKRPSEEGYPLTPNREQIKSDLGYKKQLEQILDEFRAPEIIREEDEPFILETILNPDYKPSGETDMNKEQKERRSRELKMRGLTTEELEEERRWEAEKGSAFAPEEELEDAETDEERLAYKRKQLEEEAKRERMRKASEIWKEIGETVLAFRFKDGLMTSYQKESRFGEQLPDITIKRDRGVRCSVDLFNKQNLKALYCAREFVEMIFVLAENRISRFEYHLGWTVTEKARAEFLFKDGERYILLNPKGLRISDVRLFTQNVVQRLVHEMLHNSHYYHDESFIASFHAIMEECINPNIREFEKRAREIL